MEVLALITYYKFRFVIFRFGVQLWETHFVLIWRQHFHFFYFACGFFGGLLFLITNTLLFMRILAADNILCSVFKRHLAINRFVLFFACIQLILISLETSKNWSKSHSDQITIDFTGLSTIPSCCYIAINV